MKNRDRILETLEVMTKNLASDSSFGITASTIASELKLQRSLVSHLLNDLCKEGSVIKINTRPVYFLHKEIYLEFKEDFKELNKFINNKSKAIDEDFKELIGYRGSLKDVVKQCKAAAAYPPNGLPFILNGHSGVGKSYLAKIFHNYLISKNYIEKSAPFVVFNCSEYANNPELLSSILFGCCKGAYTGADTERKGLIEEANNGVLFLDEFHRLPPEGQEKLFIFLDKGIFRRLGEVHKWRSSSLRFIFATTEDLEEHFLGTFLRRIPLVINIPSFEKRPLIEKLELIKFIYKKESVQINRDIIIFPEVILRLLDSKGCTNIGKLMNIIKISCANALEDNISNTITITGKDLPRELMGEELNSKDVNLNFQAMHLNKATTFIESYLNSYDQNKEAIKVAYTSLREHQLKGFEKALKGLIKTYPRGDTIEIIVEDSLRGILRELPKYNNYLEFANIKDEFVAIVSTLIIYLTDEENLIPNPTYNLSLDEINYYMKKYKAPSSLIEAILSEMEIILGENLDSNSLVLINTYIHLVLNKEKYINVVVLAHGSSTATSICSYCNNLLQEYVFEAIDIPLELNLQQEVSALKDLLIEKDRGKDLLLLVDMGSLELIYKEILKDYKGNIGVVNNITTLLLLDIGNKILLKRDLKDILATLPRNFEIKTSYIPREIGKEKVIITTCITGIGTGNKIKELLKKSLGDELIKIYALEFKYLKENYKILKEKYDIRLIVGTENPKLQGIEYISIEDLIIKKEEGRLLKALENIIQPGDLDRLYSEIIKYFTFENVVNNLTILNPSKIVKEVEYCVDELQSSLNKEFSNESKIGLLVHLCCMVERLVIKDEIPIFDLDADKQCYIHFKKIFKKAFSVIESYYRISIPETEIAIVYHSLRGKGEI